MIKTLWIRRKGNLNYYVFKKEYPYSDIFSPENFTDSVILKNEIERLEEGEGYEDYDDIKYNENIKLDLVEEDVEVKLVHMKEEIFNKLK